MPPIANVNIASSGFKADPFPFYAQLRCEAPVYRARLPDKRSAWLVTRYDDVLRVLKDDRFGKDKINARTPPWLPGMFKPLLRNMLDVDVVVGCNHGVQPEGADELFGDSVQVSQQKKEFAKLIENLIKANEIEFVGEEWGRANGTSAHALADANKKSWADINTSFEELDAMKIPRDYVQGAYSPEQKQNWTREREAVMVKKVREGGGKATKYLVICGFEHMEPLAEGLKKDCNTIEIIDYRQREWYQAGVFAE